MYLLKLPFRCAAYKANQVVFCCGLMTASRCVVMWLLGRGSLADQGQPLPVTTQGYLVELQSNLQVVIGSARPGGRWERPELRPSVTGIRPEAT